MRFGPIVRSLRRERLSADATPWTQQELADASSLALNLIRHIEQGQRKHYRDKELNDLAEALNLTTLERREFFAVATQPAGLSPHRSDESTGFDALWSIVSNALYPTYLIDPLCNLLAINGTMMNYAGYTVERLQQNRQGPIGTNILEMAFQPDAPLKRFDLARWEAVTRTSLHHFRYTALRYRHLDCFARLIEHLRRISSFDRLWQMTRTERVVYSSEALQVNLVHARYGPLAYATSCSTTYTPHGPLYLIAFIPLGATTVHAFSQAAEDAPSAQRVAPWPNPDLLE